jgi:phosphoglycolate phosphatase-like HAD superfamily hydrolase
MDGGSGDMTLAFDLEALKRLARPDAVFNDARQWSEYVGVISEKPTYVVTNFTRKHRIRQDFFSGPRGREESLANVKEQFGTDRHVYVGTTDEDADVAEAAGWEFLAVEDAAEAAEWELGDAEETAQTQEDTRDDWP